MVVLIVSRYVPAEYTYEQRVNELRLLFTVHKVGMESIIIQTVHCFPQH